MNDYEAKVTRFHVAMEAAVGEAFSVPLLELRRRLIEEEVSELYQEIDQAIADISRQGVVSKTTRANLLKEMSDVQYVLSGMAVTFGLPADKAFERVHESNMSKLDKTGQPIRRADGKIIKGPDYRPPVMEDL